MSRPLPSHVVSTSYAVETGVEPLGGGRYRAGFSRDWWVHVGPNGGIAAGILLRACSAEVEASGGPGPGPRGPGRVPRTLTVHYLAPPVEGEALVEVTVERSGRGMTFVSARMQQNGRAVGVALAVYAAPRTGAETFDHVPCPEVPGPELCAPLMIEFEGEPISLRDRWDCRRALGPTPTAPGAPPPSGSGSHPHLSGGWLRLTEAVPLDHHVLAGMSDAWIPPVILAPRERRVLVPTVELTVHFRDAERLASLAEDAWFLCAFQTRVAQEGFIEEDGHIWSADGRLLVECRQLALIAPFPIDPAATPAAAPTDAGAPA